MSDTVIKVEGLGKKYVIGHQTGLSRRQSYKRFSDVVLNAAKAPLGWLKAKNQELRTQNTKEDFWALKDVSFEIKRGDVVGIIGRNGAGKSTLLKILSRITEPSKGRIEIDGRVASLLEVGTGFHPELTGRENIFLNGAILGMTRAEIRRKFDEIVAFAEVEKFLDTPVKRYSSGMYVRLAFAVAAHLEPEILVVDEVLAVGDAQFQKKCLGKMQEVSRQEGRTVLFVSHNMASISNLCQACILLHGGRVKAIGRTASIIESYLLDNSRAPVMALTENRKRSGSGCIRFVSAIFETAGMDGHGFWVCGRQGRLILNFKNFSGADLVNVQFSVGINDQMGQRILLLSNHVSKGVEPTVSGSMCRAEVTLPRVTLLSGVYGITLFASINGEIADWIQDAGSFSVESGDFYGTGKMPENQGLLLVEHSFSFKA